MATSPTAADEPSSPSDRRLLHRLLGLKKEESASPAAAADRNPLIEPNKKKGGLAVALRGLGCASASSSQAYAPAAAAVRSSADWQGGGGGGKRPPARRRRVKAKKKERRGGQSGASSSSAADVWCAPGIGFAGGDPSVDCVVERHQMVGRGVERTARERAYSGRRGSNHEHLSTIMDTLSSIEAPLLGSDLMPPPPPHFHHSRGYHRSPGGLEEIMMFQTRILLGGMDVYDRYRDLRLDVDNMSYEELLELGERIGHVSTGLREDEISRSVRKAKHTIFDASPLSCFSTEIERKCSICQEEYEVNDEMGKLDCGHGYHAHCIKQWLLQKNACPVCKTSVAKT